MKIKKTLAAVLAALCVTSSIPAVISSAAYDNHDVNRDGSVDMLDVLAINQHLMGSKYYMEYNRLDVNQSHTVDAVDANCVLNKILGIDYSVFYIRQYGNGYKQPVSMPAVNSFTPDAASYATTGRTYKRYSYKEGKYLSNYTLTPNNMSIDADTTQTRELINNDDNRTVAHGAENAAIVAIGTVGTGFIVGDHTIATAASCVYEGGQIKKDLFVYRHDTTGNIVGIPMSISEIHVPASYSTKGSQYDYALITVDQDLSNLPHFDIGNAYSFTASEAGSIPLHVTGQPYWTGDALDDDNPTGVLYTHNGSVHDNSNGSMFFFNMDATNGQEGAPVYTITREAYNGEFYYTYTALSLYTDTGNGYNRGPRMTKHHLMFYGNNPYVSY